MLEAEGAKHKGVNNLSCGEWKFTECLGGIADVIPNGSVSSTVAKRPLSPQNHSIENLSELCVSVGILKLSIKLYDIVYLLYFN